MIQINSGGQTGVDRGALDAALELGWAVGGWCPQGRLAEDGPIEARYGLKELPGAGYAQRTVKNVADSPATVILHFGPLRGGTAYTAKVARRLSKPLLLLDAHKLDLAELVEGFYAFHLEVTAAAYNLAGPRASNQPRAHELARQLVLGFAARLNTEDGG
ncbi:MAG: putative molybdenum carrier protein [bacterium]|nr:putative molybdenum carrier protein [bacterium]